MTPKEQERMIDLAGDMWNELENLRDLWTGTDREVHCLMLIEEYEKLAGITTPSLVTTPSPTLRSMFQSELARIEPGTRLINPKDES